MAKQLSARQQAILDFIGDYLDKHQYPPTIRDIQNGCDISSTSVVDYNLRILQREGHLSASPRYPGASSFWTASPGAPGGTSSGCPSWAT